MGVWRIFSGGWSVFGVLFPVLFALAAAVLSIIVYEALCWIGKAKIPEGKRERMASTLDGLCVIATLVGSLQTIISLCIVGFSMWFGALQVGAKAFAILIQGFASTGFGITVAIVGRSYLQAFHPEYLSKGDAR